MPAPPASDSQRQVIPKQTTGFVRRVIGIKTTRYISLPPSLAVAFDIKIGDTVYIKSIGENVIAITKHANGPRHD